MKISMVREGNGENRESVTKKRRKRRRARRRLLRNEGFAEKNELIVRTCLDQRLLSVNNNKVFDVTEW